MQKKITFLTLVFIMIALTAFCQQEQTKPVPTSNIFIFSFLGCIIQEFIYWFELRNDIAKGNIPVELNSSAYWIITTISILIFSTASFFYFSTIQSEVNFFTIAVFAAGFPRLFKGAVQQLGNQAMPQLPITKKLVEKRKMKIRDYLMM